MTVFHQALVTGATSGIGLKMSELLAEKGISLILTGRNDEELQKLQSTLSKKVDVQTIRLNLESQDERQKLIQTIHQNLPDLVINNAGFGLYGDILSYTTAEQLQLLEVNGKAAAEISIESARSLISAGKKGVILNVSSAAAFQIMPKMVLYSSSKSFIKQFSQAFDFEVKPYGVRILTFCPGVVATNFQKRAGGAYSSKQTGVLLTCSAAEAMWKQIQKLQPLLIFDWKYRLLTFFSSFIPKKWIAAYESRIINERIKPRKIIKVENQ